MNLDRALNSLELMELRGILGAAPECMSLAKAEGFLTALASAPTMIPPSTWLPMLLGGLDFGSPERAQHGTACILQLYNQILRGMDGGDPCLVTDFDDDSDLRAWCGGYLQATYLDPAWRGDRTGILFLFPIAVLAGEFDLRGEADSSGQVIEDPSAHIESYRKKLPALLLETYEYFRLSRSDEEFEPAISSRVARNEPCPCGSGRKYKRCCGQLQRD